MAKKKQTIDNAPLLFPEYASRKAENASTAAVMSDAVNPDAKLLERLPEMDVEALAAEVRRHNRLYSEGTPVIQDDTFDRLVDRLRALAPSHPALSEMNSPDVAVSSSGKVRHDVPMLSIHKPDIRRVFEEIQNWLEKFPGDVVATPKIDGLACSIRYDANGRILVASTRGNGRVGENITGNAMYIEGIPKQVAGGAIEVRGEVYMPLHVFREFEGDKNSARNLAVGGLKQKIASDTANYHLSFFAYEVVGREFASDVEKFRALRELGFVTPEWTLFRRSADTPAGRDALLRDMRDFCESMTAQRDTWDFDADGIVFKVADNRVQREMGSTDHHPRCAIAFKFPCMERETTLREVRWQVAKGATITPVAVFDTVELAGAMVRKATLSNAGMVEEFPVGKWDGDAKSWPKAHLKIGARLLASRRGDVIPHIEYIVSEPENAADVVLPTKCPSCGALAIRDGLFLRCSDPDNCPATGQALVENYTKVIGCLGFGARIIESLYDSGAIETPADLYRLTVDSIAVAVTENEDGKPDPDAVLPKKLYDMIQATKRIPLAKFLEAISIPSLGRVGSQKLAKECATMDGVLNATLEDICVALFGMREVCEKRAKLYYGKIQEKLAVGTGDAVQYMKKNIVASAYRRDADWIGGHYADVESLRNATEQELCDRLSGHLSDMVQEKLADEKSAKSARTVFSALVRRRPLIEDLLRYVTIAEERATVAAKENAFSGKSFLFTGALEHMKREEAQRRVEALGGTAATGVSKKLSVLVATSNTSSKWQKAQVLNEGGASILLWTEEEFLRELEKAEAGE